MKMNLVINTILLKHPKSHGLVQHLLEKKLGNLYELIVPSVQIKVDSHIKMLTHNITYSIIVFENIKL